MAIIIVDKRSVVTIINIDIKNSKSLGSRGFWQHHIDPRKVSFCSQL